MVELGIATHQSTEVHTEVLVLLLLLLVVVVVIEGRWWLQEDGTACVPYSVCRHGGASLRLCES